jgi:steroid delta-isomerase-like uncharacterized protein
MGVAENKALVLRFYEEVWDKGNVEFASEVFRDDYVRHDLRVTPAPAGPAGQSKIAADFREAFSDARFRVGLILGDGDLVAARWTATGTHSGTFAGIEPTGKEVEFAGVNIFRFSDGKVAELWNHRDDLGLMTQLGAEVTTGPAPEGPSDSPEGTPAPPEAG